MNCFESSSGKVLDKYYYMCDDKINDMEFQSITGAMVNNPILGCQVGNLI